MKFKNDFFRAYLNEAPLPLAIERTLECEILSREQFPGPVLDIGCGEGMFAHVLFDGQVDVGIDPNTRELERAREYGAYKELICCLGDAIPKESCSFNTILSNSVLEHILEIEPVIVEAHRLLAPGGRFYATVPTHLFDRFSVGFQVLSGLGLESLALSYCRFFNGFWRHYHFHTPENWEALFKKCGFEVEATQQYCSKSVGLLDDALAPLALCSFIAKKTLNRWFFFPLLRRVTLAPLLAGLFLPLTKNAPALKEGGIVFFRLRKA